MFETKIVFIATHEVHLGVSPSLGLEYLAAVATQKGHKVIGLVDTKFNPKNIITNDEKKNLTFIESFEPDLIGFIVTTPRYQWCLKFARLIKDRVWDIPIMFGGPHPTLVPENVISKDCVDIICIGEGEEAFAEFLDNPTRDDIKNIWTKTTQNETRPLIKDLDSIPFPNKEIWRGQIPDSCYETYNIIASRGCPFNCIYCYHTALKKIYQEPYFRRRSVENVIQELEEAKEKYSIKEIVFDDDILTENLMWLKDFSNEYKERINIPFIGLSNPTILDEEKILLLKKAGCRFLMWGIQSGDEQIRSIIMRRHISNKKIIKIGKAFHKHNLQFSIDHLFGVPNCDTECSLRKSVELYNEIRPTTISTYRLYPYPKTDVIDLCLEANTITKEDVLKMKEGILKKPTIRALTGHHGYVALLTFLPLLPKWIVNKILKSKKLMKVMNKIPSCFIWFGKGINNLRGGNIRMLKWKLKNLPLTLYDRLRGYRGEFEKPC